MRCPRCPDQALQDHALESWSVRVCVQCGGIWLDPESFRDAAKRSPPPNLDPEEMGKARAAVWEESPFRCPACHITMKKGQYAYSSGVVIDRCARCEGIWLDRGELAKIRAYVNREVPRDRLLLAQMEAESIRRKFQAQEQRDRVGGRPWEDPSPLGSLLSFIWDLVSRTWR